MTKADILKLMELAGMAYSDEQPPLHSWMTVIDDHRTGVQCYIRRQGARLFIIFRGSNSSIDWAHNLHFCRKAIPYDNEASPIRVHSGFIDGYKAPQIRLRIHELITPEIQSVQIAGHSYGAALALLCAVDLQYNFPRLDYEVALFGCPRVGNRAFQKSYNKRVFKTVRVEYGNDIVTKVPFAWMGFRHVGAKIHLGPPRLPFLYSANDHYPQRYFAGLIEEMPG